MIFIVYIWGWGHCALRLCATPGGFLGTYLSRIVNSKPNGIGKSKGGARDTCSLGVQILSISCSFRENLAKSYVGTPWRVGTPTSGEILDPPLNGDNYLWGCLNMVHQYIVFRDTVMYYAPYFSSTLDGAMESYITGYVTG